MRILGILLVSAGLFSIVLTGFSERGSTPPVEIGRFNAYTQYTGFKTVTVDLSAADAPLRVVLESAIPLETRHTDGETTLTLVVNSANRTIATAVPLISPETASVTETGSVVVEVLEIPRLENGPYTLVLGKGDRDELGIVSAHLVLEHLGRQNDRFAPLGFTLVAVGALMFLLGLRRRRVRDTVYDDGPVSKTSSIGYRQPVASRRLRPRLRWGRGRDGD